MTHPKKNSKIVIKRWYILTFILFLVNFSLVMQYELNTNTIQNDQNLQSIPSDFYLYSKSDITPPPLHWSRYFGNLMSLEEGMSVVTDQYGNNYIVGLIIDNIVDFYHFDQKILLLKYDIKGNKIWERTWDGSSLDYGLDIYYDTNNNKLYVTGRTNSTGAGGMDALLIKYDENGIQEWNTTWGYSSEEHGTGVAVDSNGYIYVSGRTNSTEAGGAGEFDAIIVKFNQSGQQEWNRTWGYVNNDAAYQIAIDDYDNIYTVGQTFNVSLTPYSHGFLVKYNSTGYQQWNSTYSGGKYDIFNDVVVDSNNISYISGRTKDSTDPFHTNASLSKFNETGGLNWTRSIYSGSSYPGAFGYSTVMDSNGSIYMSGSSSDYNDIFLAKYNATGHRLWNFTTTGGGGYEVGALAINTNDDLILVGGQRSLMYSYPDVFILRYSYDPFPPWSNSPSDKSYQANSTGNNIDWYLYDKQGSGYFCVWRNGTKITNWAVWSNNSIIQIAINTNIGIGTWNYTIEFNNSNGLLSSDVVLITITLDSTTPTPPQIPGYEFILIAMILSCIMIFNSLRKRKQIKIQI